ncbi:MAG: Heterodimeric efflux ABC transporter, permease/ATP-binding subunit 1, partial [uncultured Nocardioidaceae bacterium]
ARLPPAGHRLLPAPRRDPDTAARPPLARPVPAVEPAAAVRRHRQRRRRRHPLAAAADPRPVAGRARGRPGDPRGVAVRDAALRRAPARRHAARGRRRDRHAHARGAQLAGRALQHHAAGDPQGRPARARPAAPHPDRRGAQRVRERLRRVRRAHRDHRPRGLPARRLPHRRGDRAGDLPGTGLPRPRRGAAARRCGAAAAAPAPRPPAERAAADLHPDLARHRHRRRPAHPARHRRGVHLRAQLRPAVPADPPGRRRLRDLAVGGRGGRRAGVGLLPRAAHVPRSPRRRRRRAERRRARQLPGLRAVHGRADPDLLRARAEADARDGVGPQGGDRPRARAAVARRRGTDRAAAPRGPGRRGHRVHRPARSAHGGRQPRAGGLRRTRGPARPLVHHGRGAATARGGGDARAQLGPPRPRRPARGAAPRAGAARRPRRRARRAALGCHLRRRRPRPGPARGGPRPGPRQRHRQPAVRRHAPGRRRPARPADPPRGRAGAAHRGGGGRLRRAARRLGRRPRRARSRPVRRPAPARRARAGTGPRTGRPRARGADLRGRRAHRGPDRRAGRRAPPRPDHGRHDGVAAVAAPRRPGRAAARRARRGRGDARGAARHRARLPGGRRPRPAGGHPCL